MFGEAALHLCGPPLLNHRSPGFSAQPFRAGDRAGHPCVVEDVAAEVVFFVGNDKRVVIAKALGKERHFLSGVAAHVGIKGPLFAISEIDAEFGE